MKLPQFNEYGIRIDHGRKCKEKKMKPIAYHVAGDGPLLLVLPTKELAREWSLRHIKGMLR